VGIWAYFVLIRRVSGILAVAGSLMILFLAVAPTAPGESFRLSTHAMQYNRWGFAILAVVIAECLPLRFEGTERGFGGGVSSGVLLGVLLFLKPNYGGAALVICAASMLWNGRSEGRRMLGLLAGASAAVLPFLFFIHFQLGKWIADLRMSADARSGAVPIGWAGEVFTSNLPGILIVAGLAILSQFSAPTGIRTGWVGGLLRSRSVLLVAVVYVFGCALMLTNSQQERLPLNETLAVLFLDSILRGKLRLDARHAVAITLVVAGLVAGWTSSDVLAVMNGVRLRHAMGSQPPHPLAHRVDVGGFAPLWLMDDYNQDTGMVNHGAFVTAYLSDGAALLQRERKTGEIVATFDDYNALAYAVGARPARGGLAFAWYKYHFSDRLHPDPETFFGDADLVMYPKTPDLTAGGFAGLLKYYGATLERQFAPVAESERWKLYRKRPAAVVGAAR
jgi:hypothetical protein